MLKAKMFIRKYFVSTLRKKNYFLRETQEIPGLKNNWNNIPPIRVLLITQRGLCIVSIGDYREAMLQLSSDLGNSAHSQLLRGLPFHLLLVFVSAML